MVYALHKFKHYLLGSHFKMYTYHSTLKYLLNKIMLGGGGGGGDMQIATIISGI
jgi:hypothetical protein